MPGAATAHACCALWPTRSIDLRGALRLALVQLEIDTAPRLPVGGDEAVEVGTRVGDVVGALEIERGR